MTAFFLVADGETSTVRANTIMENDTQGFSVVATELNIAMSDAQAGLRASVSDRETTNCLVNILTEASAVRVQASHSETLLFMSEVMRDHMDEALALHELRDEIKQLLKTLADSREAVTIYMAMPTCSRTASANVAGQQILNALTHISAYSSQLLIRLPN